MFFPVGSHSLTAYHQHLGLKMDVICRQLEELQRRQLQFAEHVAGSEEEEKQAVEPPREFLAIPSREGKCAARQFQQWALDEPASTKEQRAS